MNVKRGNIKENGLGGSCHTIAPIEVKRAKRKKLKTAKEARLRSDKRKAKDKERLTEDISKVILVKKTNESNE